MTSQKFLLGTLVGGVVLFVCGFVAYAVLFARFFQANTTVAMLETPIFWALIVGQLGFAALLTYIIGISGNASTSGGFRTGLVVGLFTVIGFDFTMFGTHATGTLQATVVDVGIFTLLMAIGGAAIGAVTGRGAAPVRVS
jgi:hypothetical protein